jgi:hypothetical protein
VMAQRHNQGRKDTSGSAMALGLAEYRTYS